MNSISLNQSNQTAGPKPRHAQDRIDPRPALALTEDNKPGDYSVILFDCHFGPKDLICSVVDNQGKTIGVGGSLEQACWFAKKVRESQMTLPFSYDPLLEGCTFGTTTVDGQPLRTVISPTLSAHTGFKKILATGENRSTAARDAALTLLRQRSVENLSPDQFSRICTVVTVEIMRGKSGKSTTGPFWLRPEPSNIYGSNTGLRSLKTHIQHEADALGVPSFTKAAWGLKRLNEIMDTELEKGSLRHLSMAQNHHVILRTADSPSASDCIREVFAGLVLAKKNEEQLGNYSEQRQRSVG